MVNLFRMKRASIDEFIYKVVCSCVAMLMRETGDKNRNHPKNATYSWDAFDFSGIRVLLGYKM